MHLWNANGEEILQTSFVSLKFELWRVVGFVEITMLVLCTGRKTRNTTWFIVPVINFTISDRYCASSSSPRNLFNIFLSWVFLRAVVRFLPRRGLFLLFIFHLENQLILAQRGSAIILPYKKFSNFAKIWGRIFKMFLFHSFERPNDDLASLCVTCCYFYNAVRASSSTYPQYEGQFAIIFQSAVRCRAQIRITIGLSDCKS